MDWNDPPDWVALEKVTAAQMNQQLRDSNRTWKVGPLRWVWACSTSVGGARCEAGSEDGVIYVEVPYGLL